MHVYLPQPMNVIIFYGIYLSRTVPYNWNKQSSRLQCVSSNGLTGMMQVESKQHIRIFTKSRGSP